MTALLLSLFLLPFPFARADEDASLEAHRDRFRAGMTAYRSGAYAEAIVTWEDVYRELGDERGYRVAFNLGRAYEAYGDSTRAAEKYEAYLREVSARRSRRETLEEIVLKQEGDARGRLDELAMSKGRLRVLAGATPVAVRIDATPVRLAGFIAYVAPGRHLVRFGEEAEGQVIAVVVEKGELVELTPPAKPEPKAAHDSQEAPRLPDHVETRHIRPFSPVWIAVAGGSALASIALPVATYSHAFSLRDRHDASRDPAEQASIESDYGGAKATAYATLGIPIFLMAVTGGLTAYYFLGSRDERVRRPRTPVDRLSISAARFSF